MEEGVYAFADQIRVTKAIMDATQEIQHYLRYNSAHLLKTKNPFGKQQSDIDLKANEIIFKHMAASGVVHAAISEETSEKTVLNEDGEYIVTFDPIDGSSVLDSNFSVGSVFGIWKTKDLIGKTGREMVGACIACYGTRCTVMAYNCMYQKVEELTLIKIGRKEKWIITNPKCTLAPRAKLFSFATRGIYDNPTLWKIYEQYICAGFSLRYSGCAALDINQIFVKKQGVFLKLHTISHPSRLSLVYAILPYAYLIEKAGGRATDGQVELLDIELKDYTQQVNFIAGSTDDVNYICTELNAKEGNVSGQKGSYANLLELQGKFEGQHISQPAK